MIPFDVININNYRHIFYFKFIGIYTFKSISGGIAILYCTYCESELTCHNSIDAEDVSYEVSSDTHIINYWMCSRCDLDYIEEISINTKTLSFELIVL